MKQVKYLLLVFLLIAFVRSQAQVGIGTPTPAASAQLDVSSTTKGFLPPRMNTTERNAIASPATGLTIYNTTINAFQVYNGSVWYSTVHYIGESYGGGIVFYVYDNGQHGLIAATTDQSTGAPWHNNINRFTGTLGGDGINSGAMNTAMIVAKQIEDGATNFAAKVCANYSVTVGGILYGDWYLPSHREMLILYSQRVLIGGFTANNYWTSQEASLTDASCLDFNTGFSMSAAKNSSYYVRAIRAF